jgi:NADPH:quinone reductase-like Zn-dependent oxidoreductase
LSASTLPSRLTRKDATIPGKITAFRIGNTGKIFDVSIVDLRWGRAIPCQETGKDAAEKIMKAKTIRHYGGPEVLTLEEVGRPEPGEHELVIRVRAAGVNPIDWKVREGEMKESGFHQLPLIPGWDVSGEIDQVGAGVTRFAVGDAVYSLLDMSQNGSYAEYAIASDSCVALKPETLDFIMAASVPMAALTAYEALDKMNIKKGDRVLIHGAAGSVGSFAVQLAYLRGAEVIGVASSGDSAFLSSLGAEEALAYDSAPFEHLVDNVDAVLDVIGGDILQRSWKVLRPGGLLVSTVERPELTQEAQARQLHGAMIQVNPSGILLTEIARLIDSGQLKVRVSAVLPLIDAEKAQELARSDHHRGKVVLQVA